MCTQHRWKGNSKDRFDKALRAVNEQFKEALKNLARGEE